MPKSTEHQTPAEHDSNEKIIITGGKIHVESLTGKNLHLPHVSVIDSADEVVGGFVNFLREYSVVGLAIGFVIGLQAQTLVKQLVNSFIDPFFKLLFGKSLSQREVLLHFHAHSATFTWGAFAYALLNFVFILAVIYAIVKIFKLDQLDKVKKAQKEEVE